MSTFTNTITEDIVRAAVGKYEIARQKAIARGDVFDQLQGGGPIIDAFVELAGEIKFDPSEHSARTWDGIDDLSGNIDTEEAIQYILLERKETIDDLTEMIEDERNTEEDEEYIEEYKNVLRKMGVEISD